MDAVSIRETAGRVLCLLLGLYLVVSPAFAGDQEQFDFANGLFARGFNEDAAEEYRTYLADYSEGAHRSDARYRLAESFLSLKDYDAALNELDSFLTEFPGHPLSLSVQGRRGEALYQLGRHSEAIEALRDVTKPKTPGDVRAAALYVLGKAYMSLEQPQRAADALRVLTESLPDSPYAPAARYRLAFAYLAQDDAERAAASFSALAATESASDALRAEARFRAAEVYDQLGWYEAAAKAYAQLKADFPTTEYADRALLGHAWALYNAQKYAKAEAMAREVLTAQPDTPNAAGLHYLLGNSLHKQGKQAEALDIYRAVQQKYPSSEYARRSEYKEAYLLYATGNFDAARTLLEHYVSRDERGPQWADAHYLLGSMLTETGEAGAAAEHYLFASDAEGSYRAEALLALANNLMAVGGFDEARDRYQQFIAAYPDSPLLNDALVGAGDAAFRSGDYAAAAESFSLAADGAEGTAREHALFRLAAAQYNAGDAAAGTAAFGVLVQEFPETAYAAEAHLRMGHYKLQGDHAPVEAIGQFTEAYEAQPDGPLAGEAMKGLALARYETRDLDGSADIFVRVMQTWPDIALNETTYAWVGQYLFDKGAWDSAAVAFRALLEHVPDHPQPGHVRLKIGECAEHAERMDDAMKQYAAVIETSSGSPDGQEARLRMGTIHEQRGEIDQAAELYRVAAEQSNGDAQARAWFRLGRLHESREQWSEAARHYMRVAILYLDPELVSESLWRAGQCFEHLGNRSEAAKNYEELVRDFPESDLAAKARQWLAATPGRP